MPPLALRYLSPLRTWLPGIPRAPTRLGRDTGAGDDTPVLHPQRCNAGVRHAILPATRPVQGNWPCPVQCETDSPGDRRSSPCPVSPSLEFEIMPPHARLFPGATHGLKAIADYETGPGAQVSPERAAAAVPTARRFVTRMAELVEADR